MFQISSKQEEREKLHCESFIHPYPFVQKNTERG